MVQGRRRLPLPRHRPHPRRARLPQHERRDAGPPGAPPAGQAEAASPTAAPSSKARIWTMPKWWWSPTASPRAWRSARLQLARAQGIRAGKFRLISAWPFPEQHIRELAGRVKAFVVPELNLGQMVHEVERARRGPRQSRLRPPRGRQRARSRSHSASHSGGRPMSECRIPRYPRGRANPVEPFLRMDRMPHIWCPGCGIGTTVNCFTRALREFQGRTWTRSRWSPASAARAAWPATRNLDSLPHHARPRHSVRHRPQAGQPGTAGGGLLGRRRPVRHRRQPLHPRRPPQHGHQGDLRQQPHLRHDRRPDGPHHARPGDLRHLALRRLRALVQPGATGRSGGRGLRGALDHLSTSSSSAAPWKRCSTRRASASSRCSPPAPRSTSGATRWATAWTP